MERNTVWFIAYAFVLALIVVIFLRHLILSTPKEEESQFRVVDATRLDGCIYRVGLEGKEGYFSLTQDLVKFSAMGISVDDILIYGEQ